MSDNFELLEQAELRYEAGDQQAALALVKRAIVNDGDEVNAWWALANITDDYSEKVHALERVLELDPYNEPAREMLEPLQFTSFGKNLNQMLTGTADPSGKRGDKVEYVRPDYTLFVVITALFYLFAPVIAPFVNIFFIVQGWRVTVPGARPVRFGCFYWMLGSVAALFALFICLGLLVGIAEVLD